jgi:hypothetical protein
MQPEFMIFLGGMILVVVKAVQMLVVDLLGEEEDE